MNKTNTLKELRQSLSMTIRDGNIDTIINLVSLLVRNPMIFSDHIFASTLGKLLLEISRKAVDEGSRRSLGELLRVSFEHQGTMHVELKDLLEALIVLNHLQIFAVPIPSVQQKIISSQHLHCVQLCTRLERTIGPYLEKFEAQPATNGLRPVSTQSSRLAASHQLYPPSQVSEGNTRPLQVAIHDGSLRQLYPSSTTHPASLPQFSVAPPSYPVTPAAQTNGIRVYSNPTQAVQGYLCWTYGIVLDRTKVLRFGREYVLTFEAPPKIKSPLFLRLRGTREEDEAQHLEWPKALEAISINGVGIKIQQGEPCDFGKEIVTVGWNNAKLLFTFESPDTMKFSFVIELMLPVEVDRFRNLVQTHILIPDVFISLIKSQFQFSKDRKTFIAIPLQCPITMTRIKVPVRSRSCHHVSCFDLDSWIEMLHYSRPAACPICDHYVHLSTISLDQFTLDVLKKTESTRALIIHVYPDMTWSSPNFKRMPVEEGKVNHQQKPNETGVKKRDRSDELIDDNGNEKHQKIQEPHIPINNIPKISPLLSDSTYKFQGDHKSDSKGWDKDLIEIEAAFEKD